MDRLELPDTGAENQTLVFIKNRKHSHLLSRLSCVFKKLSGCGIDTDRGYPQ